MVEFKIVEYTDNEPPRKRACINCGHRIIKPASSECALDGHYIGYADEWVDWCRRWCKDKEAEKRWRELDM